MSLKKKNVVIRKVIRYGVNGNVKLPHVFQPEEKVIINFDSTLVGPFIGIVSAVKYNTTRPRYDIDIVLSYDEDGKPNKITRIHSVDSGYVEPAN